MDKQPPPFPLHVTGLGSAALHAHAEDRMIAALNQHAPHVEAAEVKFADVNGPRGGQDKVCHALVRLRHQPPLHVEKAGDDAYALASLVADCVRQAAGRLLDKRLEPRRAAQRA